MEKLIKTIATVFGIGYLPFGRGTLAGLAGVGLYLLMQGQTMYVWVTALLILAGFLVSGRAERIFGEKDSGKIVIDDLAGMLIVFMAIPVRTPYIIIGFILYRFIDIAKIYPLKRIERLPRGWGIMLDDIAAGIYANLIIQIIARFALC